MWNTDLPPLDEDVIIVYVDGMGNKKSAIGHRSSVELTEHAAAWRLTIRLSTGNVISEGAVRCWTDIPAMTDTAR